jgi:hypothetical protein
MHNSKTDNFRERGADKEIKNGRRVDEKVVGREEDAFFLRVKGK